MNKADKFAEFHRLNPSVWDLFVKFAFDAINAGRTKFSARAIFERIRWEIRVTNRVDEFKVNDHVIPFYSRLFAQAFPAHAGLFERRRAMADYTVGNP